MAEGAHLPADGLQLLLVELLLGDYALLGLHLPDGVEPLGQVNHQPRRQRRHHQYQHVVEGKIRRLEPPLKQVERLHDIQQNEQEQGHPALAGALLQQEAEPVAEAQPVQQNGGEQHQRPCNGRHRRKLEALVLLEDVPEQEPGQGGNGDLKQARHGHSGEGPP